MNTALPVGFIFLLAVAAPAAAQITAVGPFTGDALESFESQPMQSGVQCLSPRIFVNRGDLCSVAGASGVMAANGAGGSGTIFSYSGVRLAASLSAGAVITLDTPVNAFGGMFGTVSAQSGGTAHFYDANNLLIGSQAVAVFSCTLNCGWTWNGWSAGSGPLIQRVEFSMNTGTGGGLAFDDLVALYGSLPTGSHFCNGDLTGTPCPCNNNSGHLPRGCFASGFVGSHHDAIRRFPPIKGSRSPTSRS